MLTGPPAILLTLVCIVLAFLAGTVAAVLGFLGATAAQVSPLVAVMSACLGFVAGSLGTSIVK